VAAAIGPENSQFIQNLVQNYYEPGASIAAGAFSILVILNTGSNLFIQLRASLNEFLQAEISTEELPPVRQILRLVLGRLRAFGFVLGAEILILGGLFASTGLQIAETWIEPRLALPLNAYQWIGRLFSAVLSALILALVYRWIPRTHLGRRAVLTGAAVAGTLFIVLQELMRLYLASAGIGSAFGAAGSLVVFLFWVYYTIQALFFGAALARVIETRNGAD
jgi:membrane protein